MSFILTAARSTPQAFTSAVIAGANVEVPVLLDVTVEGRPAAAPSTALVLHSSTVAATDAAASNTNSRLTYKGQHKNPKQFPKDGGDHALKVAFRYWPRHPNGGYLVNWSNLYPSWSPRLLNFCIDEVQLRMCCYPEIFAVEVSQGKWELQVTRAQCRDKLLDLPSRKPLTQKQQQLFAADDTLKEYQKFMGPFWLKDSRNQRQEDPKEWAEAREKVLQLSSEVSSNYRVQIPPEPREADATDHTRLRSASPGEDDLLLTNAPADKENLPDNEQVPEEHAALDRALALVPESNRRSAASAQFAPPRSETRACENSTAAAKKGKRAQASQKGKPVADADPKGPAAKKKKTAGKGRGKKPQRDDTLQDELHAELADLG
ncbi:hypothetical protein WJX73_000132 [Symbiochloris irregularis]|uniref:Uncharacterized protein n=1 Tax=Symbiochloris irregularis TaxID=706552 RepID=A0AAW1NNJ2_9CHLO